MNKASFLLLITLVQSQSDGIILSSPTDSEKFEDNLEDFQVKEWEASGFPRADDASKDKALSEGKRSGNDALTRRSALDKNFMRFGRNEGNSFPEAKTDFFRSGRGFRDNFIRFGRAGKDNFIRFGRGGKDGFMRFGRNFPPENFDNQFFRDFAEESFGRTGKSSKDSFIRFGKSGGSQKEGPNATNFLRFGRKREDEDDECEDVARKKREAPSAGYFREFPVGISRSASWETRQPPRHSRLTPFFPGFPQYSRYNVDWPETKRNGGTGSNFIRFG